LKFSVNIENKNPGRWATLSKAIDVIQNMLSATGNKTMVDDLSSLWTTMKTFSFTHVGTRNAGEPIECAVPEFTPVPFSVLPSCSFRTTISHRFELKPAVKNMCNVFRKYIYWGLSECSFEQIWRVRKRIRKCIRAQKWLNQMT